MKINIGFSQLTDSELSDKADAIGVALTDNPHFPTTNPTLAVLAGLAQNLRDTMATTGPGRTTAVAAARKALESAMSLLGQNLMLVLNVTLVMLATTGFDLPQPRTQTGAVPSTPQNVHLEHGTQSGEVVPKCTAVTDGGVRIYEAETSFDPTNGVWTSGGSFPNSRKMLLTGLPRAKDVWVRLRVQGTNGPSGWSDPATILVS